MNLNLEDIEGEEWADIPQFDGYYAISNFGRIWAIPRPVYSITGQHYYTKELIRKQVLVQYYNSFTKDYTDQLTVRLRYGPESYSFQVCRLVYELFVGPIDSKRPNLRVVHRDGDNCNNRYDNLVLMDGTQLYAHGLKINRRPRTSRMLKRRKEVVWSVENSPRSIVRYSLEGKKLGEYESIILAAKVNGVHRASIRQVAMKKLKQLHGFVYRYKGDDYRGEHSDFAWEKAVTQYSVAGKKMGVYSSVKNASFATGIDANTISKCALRKFRLGSGYVWRYEGDTYQGEFNGKVRNKAKTIIQYGLDGKRIKHFPSVNQACSATGFTAATLLDCAHKRTKVSHGFVWRFEGDPYKGEYKNYSNGKPVTQHSVEGKRMRTFPTIAAAAKATGLTPDNIQKNVKGANKTAGGFVWKSATPKESKGLAAFEAPVYTKRNSTEKKIIQYSPEGKKLASYPTVAEAAKACRTNSSNISNVLDKMLTAGGYVWRTKGTRYYGELAKTPAANSARIVTQYNLQGNKIRVFKSTKEAEKYTGVPSTTISAAANGKLKTTGGFIWRYGEPSTKIDTEAHFASSRDAVARTSKVVVKYSLEGERIKEFPSISAAARAEGISAGRISSAINGKTKSAVGYFWKLKSKL